MAMTLAVVGTRRGGKRLYRRVETGAENTPLAAAFTSDSNPYRIIAVMCKYSAAPTQAGVTTALDSGADAAYDATLNTGAANTQSTVFLPTAELILGDTDGLIVTAPAGGVGITASVAVYLEDA